MDIKVNYHSETIQSKWNKESTVGQLKEYLENITSLPVSNQKLLYKGKILKDDSLLKDLSSTDMKMILMGSTPAQIAKLNEMNQKREQRKNMPLPKTIRHKKTDVDTKYTFHKLSVIDEFPTPENAYNILERLKNDRGIQAIMRNRQWSVGELIELTPFEASILGYNRNGGQLIALRLRTDDLSGFRHYDSIRKVLLHELTHNVYGAHDDDFHALNRQLNKDVIDLDWTAHGGHRLTNDDFYDPQENIDDDMDHVSYEAGAYRLGGQSKSGNPMLDAAERRRKEKK